jgi:DNA polymerase I-like protein with 3'-5' exonuclease and polymerase domains
VDHTEAEEWIRTFLEKFPKTAQFLKDTAEAAHENGFIRTLLNRRRFLFLSLSAGEGERV